MTVLDTVTTSWNYQKNTFSSVVASSFMHLDSTKAEPPGVLE